MIIYPEKYINTFQTDENFKRSVGPAWDSVVDTASDDKRSTGFFSIDGDQLKSATESVFLVGVIEDAVAGTEVAGLDVGNAAQQKLDFGSHGWHAWVLGLGVVL